MNQSRKKIPLPTMILNIYSIIFNGNQNQSKKKN